MTLEHMILDLDEVQGWLEDFRYDDTTASQCARLTEARDLVQRARDLVKSVLKEEE